ncbi:MAG: CCA tRNA nucleotidyltransferase [Muribaculaceae bacterium]
MEVNLKDKIDKPVFHTVGEAADSLGRPCYVVGGYVRDLLLGRHSKDVDFVTVGSGIDVARAVSKIIRGHLAVYRNFGTAQVKKGALELEFVGARRESYNRDSRNPIVEDGTLDDDIARRDFTINAMAVCVNADSFGELIDRYNGVADLHDGLIRTPLDPDITFSDDPLRMLRAIRFATQLQFTIVKDTLDAITRNAQRISIISRERIYDELTKIMKSARPSIGWTLLLKTGLLKLIFPEMAAMKGIQVVNGIGHKDNFFHTLSVIDNVAAASDNVWLRWAALFHDIGKPVTKRFDQAGGWTFYGHNAVGAKMIPRIFRRMKFPMNEHMKYVQKLVELHMRPIALVEDGVTDSAVRRMLFEAGDDVDDLMTLCAADITSKNREKVERFRANYELVKQKMVELEERDRIRNFQPPVNGNEIMRTFGLGECHEVGVIKERIKNAILDGEIPNDYTLAREFMLRFASEALGLAPVQETPPATDTPAGQPV